MIIPEKTVSENPFMDNILYYAKYLTLNCTVKDQEEALKYETKESLELAEVYIACIENRATYDIYPKIPKEILENYIALSTNLDLYAKNPEWLKAHMASFPVAKRNAMINRLSKLARTTYIDHYDMMTGYINTIGTDWLTVNKDLYDKCKRSEATYKDLFDVLPTRTILRIIRTYLNSHGYMDLAIIWDPESELTLADLSALENSVNELGESGLDLYYNDSVKNLLLDTEYVASSKDYNTSNSTNLNQFIAYINYRNDNDIKTELANISKAMRDVFISHYDMMKERAYFTYKNINDIEVSTGEPAWMGFTYDTDIYNRCKTGEITFSELWEYFPEYSINEVLNEVFESNDIEEYELTYGPEYVNHYLINYANNVTAKRKQLNHFMQDLYIKNYQLYYNRAVYNDCVAENLDIYDMYEYLPTETLKMILNTEIPITTNLDAYAASKIMLDSYLHTLSKEDADRIKEAINKEMMEWYPKNHEEKNNYYRAFMGLPPLDSNGKVMVDTLYHTWLDTTKEFKEFGTTYTSQCPSDHYSNAYWRQQIYKFDNYSINILNELGILDSWVTNGCNSNNNQLRYRYLKYLGDNKLDLYTCRKSMNFSLIGIPSIDDADIKNKFLDTFANCRDYIIRCVYDDAYKYQSDYYNKFIIIFLLMNVVMDMCGSIPDYIINRDAFDSRCIMYYFESAGIPYYDEIPIKYQRAMLKNLNLLIKYKSSTKNMVDICNLFGFSDVKVYWYYMLKTQEKDDDGNYLPYEPYNEINYELDDVYILYKNGSIVDISGRTFCKLSEYPYYIEDYYTKQNNIVNSDGTTGSKRIINNNREDLFVYDKNLDQMIPLKDSTYFSTVKANTKASTLKFVKVPIFDKLTGYKNEEDYILSYDDLAYEETWDGGLSHEKIKQDIMDYRFNAVKTKYISVDSVANLTTMAFETSYFYNMLFDKLYSEDLLTLNINFIKSGHSFKLADIIFFMFAMMYYYSGLEDKIMYSPTQILYMKGYAFTDAVNEIFNDERYFAQTDENGYALTGDNKYEVFNVNTEIAARNYNYKETFNNQGYKIKSFNLDADIDALEEWLQNNWNMTLNDFVVSTDKDEWGKILTVMHYYSLNNSYYQKNIFSGNMIPLQYNNIIKYAYDYSLIKKQKIYDINEISHTYIPEMSIEDNSSTYGYITDIVALVSKSSSYYTYDELLDKIKRLGNYNQLKNYAYILENIFSIDDTSQIEEIISTIKSTYYDMVIEDSSQEIYILDNNTYATRYEDSAKVERLALYNKYIKKNKNYELANNQYYIYNKDNDKYNILISGYIYVRDSNGIFTFAVDNVFTADKYDNMTEIDYNKYTVYDAEVNARVLNMGDYYIKDSNGIWMLNPENCYVYIKIGDEDYQYILLKDIDNYVNNQTIEANDCYIQTDDGKFVLFAYTDFYVRTHKGNAEYNEMVYEEKPLYVKVDYETDIVDPDDNTIYYRLLSDVYKDNNITVNTSILYVKDSYGNYLPETSILSPFNTWFYDNIDDNYHLIIDSQFNYREYENPLNVLYLLIKQNNHDYYKYIYEKATKNYIFLEDTENRYIYDSDDKNIIVFNNNYSYKDTNKLIVVLNLAYTPEMSYSMDSGSADDTQTTKSGYVLSDSRIFDPSLTDGVWDENDWYYTDDSSDSETITNMNNENIWYYKNPNNSTTTNDSTDSMVDDNNKISVSSLATGFYINSNNFIGTNELIKGDTYYFSCDILTNFDGEMQIYCTFDGSVSSTRDRLYDITNGLSLHINQEFTSLYNGKPQLIITKVVSEDSSVKVGDFIEISNVKFIKAYSEEYIPVDLASVDDLIKIYKTNTAIYKWLKMQIRTTHNKKYYDIYTKMYESLMISDYNRDMFKLSDNTYALTFTEFLKTRDTVLYDILLKLKNMDTAAMKNAINEYIIEIIYVLTDYLASADLTQIYSFLPGGSITFIQQYLIKIINWFKSWKVQMLGTNVIYKMGSPSTVNIYDELNSDDDADEYTLHFIDDLHCYEIVNFYFKDTYFKDNIKIDPLDGISPDGTPYADKYDLEGDYHWSDKLEFRHRLRIMIDNENKIEYTDNESNLRLNLNDDSTNVKVVDGHKLIVNTINGDEFLVSDKNNLILKSDEDPEDVFTAQILDEINLMSGDYIEFSDIEDDEDDIVEYKRKEN